MIGRLVLFQLCANHILRAHQYKFSARFVINEGNSCGNGDRRAMIPAHAVNGYFDCHFLIQYLAPTALRASSA
jgi:hypothetical protein